MFDQNRHVCREYEQAPTNGDQFPVVCRLLHVHGTRSLWSLLRPLPSATMSARHVSDHRDQRKAAINAATTAGLNTQRLPQVGSVGRALGRAEIDQVKSSRELCGT